MEQQQYPTGPLPQELQEIVLPCKVPRPEHRTTLWSLENSGQRSWMNLLGWRFLQHRASRHPARESQAPSNSATEGLATRGSPFPSLGKKSDPPTKLTFKVLQDEGSGLSVSIKSAVKSFSKAKANTKLWNHYRKVLNERALHISQGVYGRGPNWRKFKCEKTFLGCAKTIEESLFSPICYF